MTQKIHPTAFVHEGAKLGENVEVGAYSVIGPNVEVGNNTKIYSHVLIEGHTTIGENNKFFQFCSIGAEPQDLSYKGEPTKTVIGDNNVFREYVSVHRGTLKDNQITKIGSNCLLMAKAHVGHDAIVGNNVILVNSCNLAGHVKIGDRSILGGGTNISQFVTLGRGSYIGGASAIDRDIPDFCTAYGNRVKLKGINIIGLRRQGYDKAVISEFVDFYRTMESSALSPRAFVDHEELMEEYKGNELVTEMREFIRKSEIGIAPFVK
ncbi:acyl-[acyl-carrier-protein]-UDP-N-acetylglucosamine O-acyltransferase [Bacteriovorax sp. BSW11_IV]|uniref:acyl-ACP--UDP-N-acetylglucosamine O-acyltransferase n=1 Tax=Bacteriovorax sp. BSW11_IV TaxID=1353529 RepID=UPI00038A1FE1|nr:acyl-ACP--UDP-N-acetylglucosamine O-acyltransferase [Bacteriovorax sp. BSW11_IV]EQC48941.1 acyl-[acyl-carrier-protein]-UDP-N-acetylglucosamine O-acyltransferase [Bacteriovorax sp. BSW11_IV]